MKLRAIQQGIQRQALAQALQQSLHILQMPLLDVKLLLEQELESNPALEEAPKPDTDPVQSLERSVEHLARMARENSDESGSWGYAENNNGEEETEDPLALICQPPPTLTEILLRQLNAMTTSPDELQAIEVIVGSLDEDGYLRDSLEEMTERTQIGLEDLEKALRLVQECEPAGVGAQSLQECLYLQLKAQNSEESLAARLVTNGGLEEIASQQYPRLARRFQVTAAEVEEAAQKIVSLTPRPGRLLPSGETSVCVVPDIVIGQDRGGQFHITLREDELPALRISASYQRMLVDPTVSEEVRNFVRERVQSAVVVLRGIEKRHQTMDRLAEALIQLQPEFLHQGLGTLRPMTYKQVAALIGRHPSTVARAIAQKYLECPSGIFPLSQLFSASLGSEKKEPVSAESVRVQVQAFIEAEDRHAPMSDDRIVSQLRSQGVHLARRTVAKYRQQLKIPPAHLRRLKGTPAAGTKFRVRQPSVPG